MFTFKKILKSIAVLAILIAPAALMLLPNVPGAFAASRAPNVIATTLAFDDGKVVTVQYSQIYFCNSAGPPTSASSSPCAVGTSASVDPVPDAAASTLNVMVPAFLPPLCTLLGIPCFSGTLFGITFPDSHSVFDPTLGANNFAQCPDNTSTLTCPNHPNFLDLTPTTLAGVVPLPIHSHVISGNGAHSSQGGWWELVVWLVLDPTIWPNPSTGACSAGTGCLTSMAALTSATSAQVVGPVPTTIYLFFNVVSSKAH